MSVLDLAVERLPQAKRYSHYVVSLCVFHQDSRPSFFVYEDYYICLACRAQGNTNKLLRKLSSLPERTYKNESTNKNPFTKWAYSQSLSETIRTASENCRRNPSVYLDRRGISEEYQHILQIGKMDGYITFPIYNKWGELEGAVARVGENNTAPGKYYIPKGQNPNLLYAPSWDKIREEDKVYITFGIIDAISIYILGFASASTTTGQTVNKNAFDDIRKRIIIVPDKHEEVSALKTASRLSWRGDTAILDYPLGTKDPNDLFMKNGEALYECLKFV